MKQATIQQAARQFGEGIPSIEALGQGLIHHTYKVSYPGNAPIVLQCINPTVFRQPGDIIYNYRQVADFLRQQSSAVQPPAMIQAKGGYDAFTDEEGNFWRATAFIPHSRSIALVSDAKQVSAAAHCFAAFTHALSGLPASGLRTIIPGFHDLSLRYRQFEDTVRSAHINRLLKATHVISELRDRQELVDFYEEMTANPAEYPLRIMHHDCKISNVLFDERGEKALCPVDLDTMMPGYYFSDLGDMIRSMACTEDENSTAWELIGVHKIYYDTIIREYQAEIGTLTGSEKKNIHKAGRLITYMQCLRYVTDFLENDVYYKTTYPEQNLNRALNQLILLEKLEETDHKVL
ncbi:MAG TPA: phosphotransferase [Chitinophagaceae bacterium]